MKFKWNAGLEKEMHAGGIFKGIIMQNERPDTVEFDSKDLKDILQQYNRNPEMLREYLMRLQIALKFKE